MNALGRPFVVYKFAATLDGRIAAADGTSQWITSAQSRAEVHLLRAGCDATLIAVATDADARHLEGRAQLLRVPRAKAGLDVPALLRGLYELDVRAVFLEGGPTLAGSFIADRVVDRVITYLAPALLGAGKSGLLDAGIATIADILRLDLIHVARSGPDVRLIARPVP